MRAVNVEGITRAFMLRASLVISSIAAAIGFTRTDSGFGPDTFAAALLYSVVVT